MLYLWSLTKILIKRLGGFLPKSIRVKDRLLNYLNKLSVYKSELFTSDEDQMYMVIDDLSLFELREPEDRGARVFLWQEEKSELFSIDDEFYDEEDYQEDLEELFAYLMVSR